MNTYAIFCAVAMVVAPLGTRAQEAPPSAPAAIPPLSQAQRDQMRVMHDSMQQMEQLHRQARTQMLSALTPEHRALLAQIAGALAISPNPDPRAAGAQLNAALTPAERQAVLNADANVSAQLRTLHEQMRAKMEAASPKPPGDVMFDEHGIVSRAPTLDAGTILLMTATSDNRMGVNMGVIVTDPANQPPHR